MELALALSLWAITGADSPGTTGTEYVIRVALFTLDNRFRHGEQVNVPNVPSLEKS